VQKVHHGKQREPIEPRKQYVCPAMEHGLFPRALQNKSYSTTNKMLTNGITIYGEDYCPFCQKAKQLVAHLPHQLLSSTSHDFYVNAKPHIGSHHTIPVVFVNGTFIGGCDSLEAWLRQRR
jgi:glutaredoxin